MDTSEHTLESLFTQLGLENSEQAIETFIRQNRIQDKNLPLDQAPFWNEAQATFIRESWENDADWVDAVDHLDALLRD
jgi:antitoxin component of RelBE/YafQ-DinJ toxin-antitoxin module